MEKHGTTEARRRLKQGHAEASNRQRKSEGRKNIGQAEKGRRLGQGQAKALKLEQA